MRHLELGWDEFCLASLDMVAEAYERQRFHRKRKTLSFHNDYHHYIEFRSFQYDLLYQLTFSSFFHDHCFSFMRAPDASTWLCPGFLLSWVVHVQRQVLSLWRKLNLSVFYKNLYRYWACLPLLSWVFLGEAWPHTHIQLFQWCCATRVFNTLASTNVSLRLSGY